ncbi:MAG TPA: endonuclease domain-containing protein [Bacteroidia bacterium]|nr:endonuclease domain-containing protein [Bacteroidia bacterium]
MKSSMFYGAKPTIFKNAKGLRLNTTDAEQLVWEHLSNNKLGVRFRRQHPIQNFIADFYCHKAKLVVEIDGSIHNLEENAEYDKGREFELRSLNLKILRFTNSEVFKDIRNVIDTIRNNLNP